MSDKHELDKTVPTEFWPKVGTVLTCTCGANYVAGYRCRFDKADAS
jgi:hypothetical protein